MRKTLAEKELVNTNRHIAEIAAMVGYLDPTVFSRAFKRWTGMAPRDYRKLEKDEAKLQALREKLQAGENSPIVENFDGKKFLADLHKKHIE